MRQSFVKKLPQNTLKKQALASQRSLFFRSFRLVVFSDLLFCFRSEVSLRNEKSESQMENDDSDNGRGHVGPERKKKH